jgi:hypothetical protein
MKTSNLKEYSWKYLKIVVILAAVSFVLDTYLFEEEFRPIRFTIRTLLTSGVILWLKEKENSYKQTNRKRTGEGEL